MAGIGQSSVTQSDPSTPWNSSQFTMGRSTTIDNYSNIANKCFPVSDKRRLIPEENGIASGNMYQYNRQQLTGFQSTNVVSNDKSYPTNIQSGIPVCLSSANNTMNYNMYQRTMANDSSIYNMANLDLSTQSKQGFTNNTRLGGMSQFLESSNHSYLSPTPHRTISSGAMNPNMPIFNGQSMSKNRSGSYNLDTQSSSLINQWDTHIGNFDSSEFPSLKPKPLSLLSHMCSSSVAVAAAAVNGNYHYNMPGKSSSAIGQINYQLVTRTGMPIMLGEHNTEFSIQQEDFPALPVAQNPTIVASADYQRPLSASADNYVSQSVTPSPFTIIDPTTDPLLIHRPYSTTTTTTTTNNCSLIDQSDQSILLPQPPPPPPPPPPQSLSRSSPPSLLVSSVSSVLGSLNSINNTSHTHTQIQTYTHTHSKIQKKITLGPNNSVFNIPIDMVSDAFGLVGLVKLLGINDTYDNLHLLAPGLNTVDLIKELDGNRDIFPSYVSPLSSNCAGRPHDMDHPVPKEYRIRHILIDRLADPLPDKLSDDTLFWVFYNLTGEECQLTAAKQLIIRQWRYHKKERFWLTRDPNGKEPMTHSSFELGSYIVWDPEKTKKVCKQLTVYYKDLDNVTLPLSTKLQLPFCNNATSVPKRGLLSTVAGVGTPGPMRSKTMAALLQGQSSAMVSGGGGGGVSAADSCLSNHSLAPHLTSSMAVTTSTSAVTQ